LKTFLQAAAAAVPDLKIYEQENLDKYTSFKIGGPAEVLLQPARAEEVPVLLRLIRQADLPLHILGGGSNLLVSDSGVPGVVLKISCGGIEMQDERTMRVGAGCQKAAAAVYAQKKGLSGLAFLHGIPGNLGGGVYMNAGAYGGELSQVVTAVTACDRDGQILHFSAGELGFGYRESVFKSRKELTILSADLSLMPGDPDAIRAEMDDLMGRRREKQPLEFPSAGSTFKRPEGYFAGKLIEDCGLKGYAVGGACVSEKHAGFVINRGGATADDVRRLIEHIKETVYRAYGVMLSCEVEMW